MSFFFFLLYFVNYQKYAYSSQTCFQESVLIGLLISHIELFTVSFCRNENEVLLCSSPVGLLGVSPGGATVFDGKGRLGLEGELNQNKASRGQAQPPAFLTLDLWEGKQTELFQCADILEFKL